jgi:hypothetical protein
VPVRLAHSSRDHKQAPSRNACFSVVKGVTEHGLLGGQVGGCCILAVSCPLQKKGKGGSLGVPGTRILLEVDGRCWAPSIAAQRRGTTNGKATFKLELMAMSKLCCSNI